MKKFLSSFACCSAIHVLKPKDCSVKECVDNGSIPEESLILNHSDEKSDNFYNFYNSYNLYTSPTCPQFIQSAIDPFELLELPDTPETVYPDSSETILTPMPTPVLSSDEAEIES
jgi:hypothetical protein